MIINAANVQKIGIPGAPGGVTGVPGLQDAQARITGQSVSGVGIAGLNDPSKGLMNFNIQGTYNLLHHFNLADFLFCGAAAKVISNRPGVSVAGATPGTITDVGTYGSNTTL